MTAPLLFACILGAIGLQLAVAMALVAWRRRSRTPASSPQAEREPTASPTAGAWAGWRDFRVARREFEDSASSQCSFYLEPVDGLALPAFKPGQYLTFSLQVTEAATGETRTLTRCYSLSDRPEPGHYRITVKRVPAPQGRSDLPAGASSTHLHDHVRVGDVLKVRAPAGHFYLDPEPAVPAVLVGGGIGITPMMSMLRWIVAHQPQRAVHLFYGVRHGAEQAFKPILGELASTHASLHLTVVYGRPSPDDTLGRDFQHAGHVDIELIKRTLPHGRHQFYVCGPPPMMESLVPALAKWGVPDQDIHFEAFGPASVKTGRTAKPAPAAAVTLEVHFRRTGRTLVWDGQDETLLDFADRHALKVESGCRSGGCGSCQTRLLSGTVRYDHTPDHDVAPGHCLLCVGKPETALELEA